MKYDNCPVGFESRSVRQGATVAVLTAALMLGACSAMSLLTGPLTAAGEIKLPAETGTRVVDLLALDPQAGRLYVPRTSLNTLDIIDLRAARVVGSVSGLVGIRGVALTRDPAQVVASNSGDGTVAVIDVSQRQVVTRIRVGGRPDAIDSDPSTNALVVSVGGLRKLVFLDLTTRTTVAAVELPGDPELMALDRKAGKVFLAIHDQDQVVVIDTASHKITTTYTGCDIKAPTGVAYDPDRSRLFIASQQRVNVIDLLFDTCLGVVDTGRGTDQIAINPRTHHLYAANGTSKNLSVIDTKTLKPLGTVSTGPGAATLAVDPSTDRVYVAIARTGVIAVYHDP